MILQRILPTGDAPIDFDSADAGDRLREYYRPPADEWLRLNLIGSVSGSATGSDGTSETLSNPMDRRILGVIRALADVVLVGAASVRAEGYYLPRRSPLAVVTSSGDLSGNRITVGDGRGPLLVLCPRSAASTVRRTLGNTPVTILELASTEGRMQPASLIGALRDAGYPSIVCEGGPRLATQLVVAGLVDELCLSTSPQVNGGALPLFGSDAFGARPLRLTQVLTDESSGLYACWGLGRGGGSGPTGSGPLFGAGA